MTLFKNSWYLTTLLINNFFNYSASNVFLNNIKYIYLISRSTTTIIKLYFIFVVGSTNFKSFVIKSIIISCQNSSGSDINYIFSYLTCILCLFFQQYTYFLIYCETFFCIQTKWQLRFKILIIL